jgi:hypothetical protein
MRVLGSLLKVGVCVFVLLKVIGFLGFFGRFLDEKVEDTQIMPSLLFRQGIKVSLETVLALGNGAEGVFFAAGK